jgi:hypothetical protein
MLLRLLATRFFVLPAWLFLATMTLFFVILGGCLGALLGNVREAEGPRYRCAFFLSLCAVSTYLWYALFFGARFFLPAFLLAATAAFCAVVTLTGSRVRCRLMFIAFLGMVLHSFGLLFLTVNAFFLL